jgi:hypothetical protein
MLIYEEWNKQRATILSINSRILSNPETHAFIAFRRMIMIQFVFTIMT